MDISNDAFRVWSPNTRSRYCSVLTRGWASPEIWKRIHRGLPVSHLSPALAEFSMDPKFPRERRLPDAVLNVHGYTLISNWVRSFLDSTCPGEREYLPARIYDHKGRVASDQYTVMNCLDVLDAIDQSRSRLEFHPTAPDQIMICDELVLDPQRIPLGVSVFSLRHLIHEVLVRTEVADQMEAAGFAGLDFRTLEQYVQ